MTVTDSRNNPLAGAPVTIKVPGTARYQTQPVSGLTDSRGQLRVSISNTKAGSDNYTFSINGDDAVRALKFVADETTATITDASPVIVTNNQKADGAAANSVRATIVDAYNNPVPGSRCSLSPITAHFRLRCRSIRMRTVMHCLN